MVIIQKRSRRKASGAYYKKKQLTKRLSSLGREPAMTKLGEKKSKTIRTLGGSTKQRLLGATHVNLIDKKNKAQKVEILKVLENPANRHFVRRNILTKGTIIETKVGKAKITSRPGQDGTVNAVLV